MSVSSIQQMLVQAFTFHQAGRLDQAAPLYREVLKNAPNHFDALHMLGVLSLQTGHTDEALRLIDTAIAVNPHDAVAINNRGNILRVLERHQDALDSYARAVALRPEYAEALKNTGDTLQHLGRHDDALAVYTKALAREPGWAELLNNYGASLAAKGCHAEALETYNRALASKPAYAPALSNRADALRKLGRENDALASYREALGIDANLVETWAKCGNALRDAHRYSDAIASYEHALALRPDYVEVLTNRGSVLQECGRIDEALASFDRALASNAHYPEAHWNRGLTLLAQQQFSRGWADYEWRWKCEEFKCNARPFRQPPWDGREVDGALLLWSEQGLGDEVFYAGMVGDLIARGYTLLWEADARLVPLLQRSYPDVRVIARSNPPHPATQDAGIAAQISTASLGQYLRTSLDQFPRDRPAYLKSDTTRAAAYRDRVRAKGQTRLVGVSWASTNPARGVHKTCDLNALGPLWRAVGPDTLFVDLQYGDTAAERRSSNLPLTHLEDLDLFNDIDGLAALISICDRVVTVSNTTAHLAGALGVPVDIIVPAGNGRLWYWGVDQEKSPWYPSATLYKQTAANVWDDTITRIIRRREMP